MSGRQHAKNGGGQMTDTADFGTFGRYRQTPADKLAPEMKAAYDYTLKAARAGARAAQDLSG